MVNARIELTFDALRANCVNFLVDHGGEVQAMVDRQLDALLAEGQIEKLIRAQIEQEIRQHLQTAIKDGVRHAFWDSEAKTKLAKLIVDGMAKFDDDLKEGGYS